VWFPVLAEDVLEQLTRIGERINPDEICPVLPVQSANARRADNIIDTLGEFLFDRYDVDTRDILRATEWNPFQLYRSLMQTMARYEESLKLFGGARFVLSPLSSKGLSIGCLLATFEKRAMGDRAGVRVGMAHVESRRYEAGRIPADAKYQLISAWIAGECYGVPATTAYLAAEAPVGPPEGADSELTKLDATAGLPQPSDRSIARRKRSRKSDGWERTVAGDS